MATIAVLLADLFEDSEYLLPAAAFRAAGHQLVTVGLVAGNTVRGKKNQTPVRISRAAAAVVAGEFDALFIPGGHSPDRLRYDRQAIALVEEAMAAGKPVFAICHGPLMLVAAQAVAGRKVTGWKAIARELRDAGGEYLDQEVVVDDNLVTSRGPADLPAFIAACLAKL